MTEEYSKGRDYLSATKLNYFHYFLKQLTGYDLHPSIDTTHPLRIADLGTQTAIWPITIADDPNLSATLDGFDLSAAFYPPQAWLPKNVRLHLHDIHNPFSEELLEQFDVVHLRLFLTLSIDKLSAILANAIKLLKPGGYIQWTEHDKTVLETTAITPELSAAAAEEFIKLQQNPFPHYNASWINYIAPAMIENGLSIVSEDHIRVRPSMLPQMNELHLISLMDVVTGLSPAIDHFRDKYLNELKDEYSRGVSTVDGFLCVVGQKPET